MAAGAIWVLTAEAIGVPYRRLRRAVSQDLGKPDQRNADHPQSLATVPRRVGSDRQEGVHPLLFFSSSFNRSSKLKASWACLTNSPTSSNLSKRREASSSLACLNSAGYLSLR